MIFVTVGTQLPFDRMIRAVDEWAGLRGRGERVFAQIGPSQYRPRHIEYSAFIGADEFQRRTREARAIVAHAGMGSIITALEMGKPILVMPRRAAMGEQRNDHQLATAKHFLAQGRIGVAADEDELLARLDRLDELCAAERIEHRASARLLRALRRFARCDVLPAGVGPDDRDALDERAFQHDDFIPEPVFVEPAVIAAADAAGVASPAGGLT
jgi:UDP-N-acetylglucosamine transferase subunit ALG13